MKLRELASKIVIDPRKLTEYVLDPSSVRGADKARLFASMLGYTQASYEQLMEQILRHAPDTEVFYVRTNPYGKVYYTIVTVEGSSGQQAPVRVGWFVANGGDEVSLKTAWPLTEKRRGGHL